MYIPSKAALFGTAICLTFAGFKFYLGTDLDLAIIALIIGIGTLFADYMKK